MEDIKREEENLVAEFELGLKMGRQLENKKLVQAAKMVTAARSKRVRDVQRFRKKKDEIAAAKKRAKQLGAKNQLKVVYNHIQVHSQEEAMERLMELTGIREIDALVTEYINSEDRQLSLVRVLNNLHDEIALEVTRRNDLQEAFNHKQKRNELENTPVKKKSVVATLRDKLTHIEAAIKRNDAKHKGLLEYVESMAKPIKDLFDSVGCPTRPKALQFQDVNAENMMEVLGVLEQYLEEKNDSSRSSAIVTDQVAPAVNPNPKKKYGIKLPDIHGGDSDDDEDLSVPSHHEDLLRKMIIKM